MGRLVVDLGTAGDSPRPGSDLTGYEFDLCGRWPGGRGGVLSREQLMELARGNVEEAFDRSIDVHISRLRQKLGDDPRRYSLDQDRPWSGVHAGGGGR